MTTDPELAPRSRNGCCTPPPALPRRPTPPLAKHPATCPWATQLSAAFTRIGAIPAPG
jgi:hypothetical protein